MTFRALYEQSSKRWCIHAHRIRHAPDWNVPLNHNSDHLIIPKDTLVGAQDHPQWFSCYRDRFHDQLPHTEPKPFPCTIETSSQPQLFVSWPPWNLRCVKTPGPILNNTSSAQTVGLRLRQNARFVSWRWDLGEIAGLLPRLHDICMVFVRSRSKTDVARPAATCPCCKSPQMVQMLKMQDTPWIRFERERNSPVTPSPTVLRIFLFGSSTTVYRRSSTAVVIALRYVSVPVDNRAGGGNTMARWHQESRSIRKTTSLFSHA